MVEMDTKATIGRFIRKLREQKQLTQEQLATKTGITYQHLSGMENGRENFTIDIFESLSRALSLPLPQFIAAAFAPEPDAASGITVNRNFFRPEVPLPPGMKISHLEAALNMTQGLVARINSNLIAGGAKPLPDYIQGNNFSGLVSNLLCDALHDHSPYKHNSHQAYPDLLNTAQKERGGPAGLEVKSTIQIGKGGESHNGHSGWHLIACFKIESQTGNIRFIHLMFAILNGHNQPEPDWTYVGSKVNAATGSRRTETYNTTLVGLTKLRDGSVFLDNAVVSFKRWRQKRNGPPPPYSIFAKGKNGRSP
jgi:DNA-binding XRE family transcriptional regulator